MVSQETQHTERRKQSEHYFYSLGAEKLGVSKDIARKSLEVFLSHLIHRIAPQEAKDLLAQLPANLRENFPALGEKPNRKITAKSLRAELESIGAQEGKSGEELAHLCWQYMGIYLNIDPDGDKGELHDVVACLPQDIRDLLSGRLH